jgi:hypothetical protein
MISGANTPFNQQTVDSDFTIKSYRELLIIAKQRYTFASYGNIPWGQQFVLWRHDCDYSLNRAHAIACIEVEEGVRSTFFINPHCEFYNLLEKSQFQLIKEILEMGHEIGLHFDAAFQSISDEVQFNDQITKEAALLENLYGFKPLAFSFHNPITAHLNCEKDTYGGLVNCYSERFKAEVPYCSDSNGHWRFRRLKNVLSEATDPCLQVLTHPGWWQESAMPPRQRIFRAVYGRADATIRFFDKAIEAGDRENPSGPRKELAFFRAIRHPDYELLDQLFHRQKYELLALSLWRFHEIQINLICKAQLLMVWKVPVAEVNALFESSSPIIDGVQLFKSVFDITLHKAVNVDLDKYSQFFNLRNELIHGRVVTPQQRLEDTCIFLCATIESLASWGRKQLINYDEIDHLGLIGIPTCKTEEGGLTDHLEGLVEDIPSFPKKKWEQLKAELQKVSYSELA